MMNIWLKSHQNKVTNKLERILYKLFPSSLEFYRIYLVGQHFTSSFTVSCCRSVYVNHISNKMQYNNDSQPPVHRLLMVYKASEKASTKTLQRCLHKSMYICAYSYNVWAYLHSLLKDAHWCCLPQHNWVLTFSQLLFPSVVRHYKQTCRSH